MNLRNTITMLTLVCLSSAAFVGGCKKKEETAPPPPPPPKTQSMEGVHQQAAEANEAVKAELASIEQKTCPITDQPIDPTVFIEYKGKKVYFCCSACIPMFNKNPDKYISKLPQFSK